MGRVRIPDRAKMNSRRIIRLFLNMILIPGAIFTVQITARTLRLMVNAPTGNSDGEVWHCFYRIILAQSLRERLWPYMCTPSTQVLEYYSHS